MIQIGATGYLKKKPVTINIVNDKNEIDINEECWSLLNKRYSREEIKIKLSETIEFYNIPMPLAPITWGEAYDDFEELRGLNAKDLYIENIDMFSRYEYFKKWWKPLGYIKSSNIGSKSSNYFMQEARWMADSINSPSPYRSWTTHKFRMTLFNALWSMKFKKVNMATLRSCIALRKYICSQFRPSAAKCLYQLFDAKSVLDPCAGWGDRLIASLANNETSSYLGTDPNLALQKSYEQIIKCHKYGKWITQVDNKPAEDIDWNVRNVDLVFTSPPYYDVERYTHENNQSWKRYKKLEDWKEKFLFKMLKNAYQTLKVGGIMAINISDVYAHHKVNRICDDMNQFIEDELGAEYQGVVGYEMRKRPNSKTNNKKNGIFVEPIWIWKKMK